MVEIVMRQIKTGLFRDEVEVVEEIVHVTDLSKEDVIIALKARERFLQSRRRTRKNTPVRKAAMLVLAYRKSGMDAAAETVIDNFKKRHSRASWYRLKKLINSG